MDRKKQAGHIAVEKKEKRREKRKRIPGRYRVYFQALPEIMKYQILTKGILALLAWGLGALAVRILNSVGKTAVSTGDFRFLFQTWQGGLFLLLGLSALFLYVSLDLNAKILYSDDILTGRKDNFFRNAGRGLLAQGRFFNLGGFLTLLYIVLLAPLVGHGISVSLTRNFYVPRFIMETIRSKPLFYALYAVFYVLMFLAGFLYVFTVHEIVIGKKRGIRAMRNARKLFWENKWDFLKEMLLHSLRMLLIFIGVGILVFGAGMIAANLAPMPLWLFRFLNIDYAIRGILYLAYSALLITPFYVMKTTELYHRYSHRRDIRFPVRRKRDPEMAIVLIVAGLLACAVISGILTVRFDSVFPHDLQTAVIAHRGGGTLGAENTVDGLLKAAELGVWGSEIDIQRTADGHYVVNHDSTFKRTAGDTRRAQDMTLEEIRQLRVRDAADPAGQPVATLEEMLDAARGRVILFVELKGATADHRMADDAVRMIKEADMTQQTVLISMKYELVEYVESHYPEIQTGYLTFASYGKTAQLSCDYLGLEEESATPAQIRRAHRNGKKILVWTVNDETSQRQFLLSGADAVITDRVAQAQETAAAIESRPETVMIAETLYHWISDHILSL